MRHLIKILIVVLGLAFAVNCSHARKELPYNSGEYTDSHQDQVEQFGRELTAAKTNQVDVLAPEEYNKAIKSFEKAKEIARKSKDYDDLEGFRDKMHDARMHLDRAKNISKQTQKPSAEAGY